MTSTAVVILNWNGRELLRHYLPSVIANSCSVPGVEVIVADNASSDGSIQMLHDEFPSVPVISFDKNYGFAGGYNRALAALRHDYVVLLNSDVAPAPGWLSPLISLLDADPSVLACGPKIRDDKRDSFFEYAGAAGGFVDAFGYPFCRGRVMDSVEEDRCQYDDDADVLWVSGAALMVRRQAYIDAGGLDEDFFAHMEEIDLCWRLRNRGGRVVACGAGFVFHLGGATLDASNPRKTFLNFRNNLSMIIKNYNRHSWPFLLFARLCLDGVAALKFLLSGKPSFFWAVVRAHFAMWTSLPSLIAKRAALRPFRSSQLCDGVKPYSMIWRHVIRHRQNFSDLDN